MQEGRTVLAIISVTGEPVAMKVARRVRGGGVEKGHSMYLVGVLLYHMAHEDRDDGSHSPAQVLNWQRGIQREPELLYRTFSAIGETRVLNKAGYAKFRNFLLYGEQGLAGQETLVNIFQDTLTLEYGEYSLSKYSVEWQSDDRHLLRIGNPRLYEHPYHLPQLPLWDPSDVEWRVIIRCEPKIHRKRRVVRSFVVQPALFFEENDTKMG